MNPFVDTLMMVLFVLFMVFIFNGYHKTKFSQREEELKKSQKPQEEKE